MCVTHSPTLGGLSVRILLARYPGRGISREGYLACLKAIPNRSQIDQGNDLVNFATLY